MESEPYPSYHDMALPAFENRCESLLKTFLLVEHSEFLIGRDIEISFSPVTILNAPQFVCSPFKQRHSKLIAGLYKE